MKCLFFNTYGSAIHCLEKILLQTNGTDSLIIWVEKKIHWKSHKDPTHHLTIVLQKYLA